LTKKHVPKYGSKITKKNTVLQRHHQEVDKIYNCFEIIKKNGIELIENLSRENLRYG
jgi:hypothetical protein